MKRLIHSLFLAALAAISISCTSGAKAKGYHQTYRADGSTIPTSVTWEQLPVLGAAIRSTPDEAIAIVAVTQSRMYAQLTACVNNAGYPIEHVVQPGLDRYVAMSKVAHPPDVETARRRGFFVSQELARPLTISPDESWQANSLTPEEKDNYDRVVADCDDRSFMQLTSADGTPVATLVDSYRNDVLADPLIAEARDQWASCMHDRGHNVSVFIDVVNGLLSAQSEVMSAPDETTRASAEAELWSSEQQAAIDVAECDIEAYSPVIDKWAELEDRWLDRNAAVWDSIEGQVRLGFPDTVGL